MKSRRHYIAASTAVAILAGGAGQAEEADRLILESGPGSAAGMTWTALRAELGPAGGMTWSGRVEGLGGPAALGSLTVDCVRGRLDSGMPACSDGGFEWSPPGTGPLTGAFTLSPNDAGEWTISLTLDATHGGGTVSGRLAEDRIELQAEALSLELVPEAVLSAFGLNHLEGRLTALELATQSGRLRLRAEAAGLGWDNHDGTLAGGGVDATVDVTLSGDAGTRRFEVGISQSAGELLLGPVYMPPPSIPLTLELDGELSDNDRFRITRLMLDDPETLSVRGSLSGRLSDGAPEIENATINQVVARLPAAQVRYLDGVLGRFGLGDLTTTGRVAGSGRWHGQVLETLQLDLADIGVHDPRERFGVAGLNGGIEWTARAHRLAVDLAWTGAGLYALPLGGGRLELATADSDLSLQRPLEVPLFDGAVVLETFRWRDWRGDEASLELDARIEPVDLARLSRALDWPALGGTLSGGIREVTYTDGVLGFGGGIDIAAFSGSIQIDGLSIERPFGTLPVLAADIRMDDLNLLEVTGAFGFGRMEGRMDARVAGLRMLNWQPVALDAELYTVPGAERQRISQRAVDNLSSLGGAGGAALAGTFLRFFEDFGYRRAGLSCRLSNNICRMGGVAETEAGGYLIVEGRGLPHLDVVGHRRLVDWPRLVTQLRAAAAGQ